MKNLPPETRLEKYKKLNNPDGIDAMFEIISKREHQKTMREFVDF